MEECFLSNKAVLIKPSGGSFTSREIDIISCIVNGGTIKSTAKVLNISPYTVNAHLRNIRSDLNCISLDQIIKCIEESEKHIQIRERYIDLLLFNKFYEIFDRIKALEISPQNKCVMHVNVEEIDKYILLHYLKLASIRIDLLYDSADYADDKFHIICCSGNFHLDSKNLQLDNIVISENHNNNAIDLAGQCIESNGSGTQYRSYFSLLGCISKIYSSKQVDDILDEFKEYYHNKKDRKSSTDQEQHHIEITDKRKSKYVIIAFIIFLLIFLIIPIGMHLHNETHKTILTNINILVGQDVLLQRKDLSAKMDKILSKQKGVKFLVLVGQGGIGKTTLAKHYIYTNDAKIKWKVNAETRESTINSFLELAIELSKGNQSKKDDLKYIQAIEDPKIKRKSLISFVFSQLKTNGEWYVLFDNIDDFKMVYPFISSNKDLCGEGVIIITTRDANCSNLSFIPDKSVVNIEYLEKNEKKKLFCDILYGERCALSDDKIEVINKFLEHIPPMPLDISNAAYYIKNTNDSFDRYLEILKFPNEETDRLHSKFLNEGIKYNQTRYRMTLAVLDKLIEINPNFKELLLFVCLLDSKKIPRKYLNQCRNSLIVADFICNLKRFFSITLDNDKFSVHKSVQEIGLMHLVNLLTKEEKEAFFKKIISIMTPYSSILWQKYKAYPCKLTENDFDELEVNIKSMINNLKSSRLSILESDKYITKLLLAVGFIYGENNSYLAKHFLNEALKCNGNNGYIENYEYAIALLTLGYANLVLDKLDDAKLWLNKGLEFCKNLNGAEILTSYGLCDLGRYYAKINEFSMAITLLEKALSIVDNNQESWARNTASQMCLGLSHIYSDHCINKPDGNKAIVYAHKSLKKLGLECMIGDTKNSYTDSGVFSRWCLTKAYNRIGEYDNAQKCADSYYYLYEKYFKNHDRILDKALVDIEYGHTLLRKGNLNASLDILNRVISKKQKLNDSNYLFHALVSRTEALIRLNKLDEAYLDFQYAISQKSNSADNYTKLLYCMSLYHGGIIKHKQCYYKLSIKHFSAFCIAIKDFCKNFLNESEYNKLLNANVFETIADKSQIKTCLQNSIYIFSSILGKHHPFVNGYVRQNINR